MLNHLEYSELSILQIGQIRSETQASLCTLLFSQGFLLSVSVLHLFLSCSNFTFLYRVVPREPLGLPPSPPWALCLFWVCPNPHIQYLAYLGFVPHPHLGHLLCFGFIPCPHLGHLLCFWFVTHPHLGHLLCFRFVTHPHLGHFLCFQFVPHPHLGKILGL